MNHLVSIITPLYNAEQFIAAMIKSVLSQTYQNWELLITDDYSTDNSVDIVQAFAQMDLRIKVFLSEKNGGPGVARNNSIAHAQGRFIAFLDSDDQWKPDKLEKQVKFMIENDLALSYHSYETLNEEDRIVGIVKSPKKVTYKTMLRNNYIGCLTAMYDTEKLVYLSMPSIKKRQDWAMWLSILKQVPFALGLQENLAIYRDSSKSISSNKINLIKYNYRIFRNLEKFSGIKSFFLLVQFMFFYILKKIYFFKV
ncbi:MAG: glycosyltransferase [Clostridioides sp.]|jgi:glycosyltransferase involved in cell wall biosynthesis|nr:glycosyltransferase [Clostridioides sp.]